MHLHHHYMQLIGIQKKIFSFNYNIKNRYSALSQKEKIKGIEISKKILKKNF